MHSRMPRLRLAQSGSGAPQSAQNVLPGILRRVSRGLLSAGPLKRRRKGILEPGKEGSGIRWGNLK